MGEIKKALEERIKKKVEDMKKEFFENKKSECTQTCTETIESVFAREDVDEIERLVTDYLRITNKYIPMPKKEPEISPKEKILNYATETYADKSFIAQDIVDGTGFSMAIVKANLRQLRKEAKLDKEDGTWTLKGTVTYEIAMREAYKQYNEEGYVTSRRIQQRLGASEDKLKKIGYAVRSFVKKKELGKELVGKEYAYYRPGKRPQFLTPAEEIKGYIGDKKEIPLQQIVEAFGDRFKPNQIISMLRSNVLRNEFYLDKKGVKPKLVRK